LVVTAGQGDVERAGERQQPLEVGRGHVTSTAGRTTRRTQHHARLRQGVVDVFEAVFAVLGTDHGVGDTAAHFEQVEVDVGEVLLSLVEGRSADGGGDAVQGFLGGA